MAIIIDSLGGITNLTYVLNVSSAYNFEKQIILDKINELTLQIDLEVSQLCIIANSLIDKETSEYLDIDLKIIDRLNFH
jgi:hypothetical protein